MKPKTSRRNPFEGYQKERVAENLKKVMEAIQTLQKEKKKVSYAKIAELTKISISGLTKNHSYVKEIEIAKGKLTINTERNIEDNIDRFPKTLEDSWAIIRVLKSEAKDLRNKVKVFERLCKNYNIVGGGDAITVTPASPEHDSAAMRIDAIIRVFRAILEDRVYTIEKRGLFNIAGQEIVPMSLLQVAGLRLDNFDKDTK